MPNAVRPRVFQPHAAAPVKKPLPGVERDRRGTRQERGYTDSWIAYSRHYRQEHPLCCECELNRVGPRPAQCVDHIVAVTKDDERFMDQYNHAGLCHRCHSRKTSSIDGGFGNAAERFTPTPNRFVVCGLPAVGKSTWVAERASSTDLVWDADVLAKKLYGVDAYPWPDHVVTGMLDRRDEFLRRAADTVRPVYVVVASTFSAAVIAHRLRANMVHLTLDMDERARRIEQRKPPS